MSDTTSPREGLVRCYSRVCPGLWVDVPEQRRESTTTQRTILNRWRAGCRANPGQWRRYPGHIAHIIAARSLVSQIQGGAYQAWRPAGSWQAEARADGDEAAVWVRYVAEPACDTGERQ